MGGEIDEQKEGLETEFSSKLRNKKGGGEREIGIQGCGDSSPQGATLAIAGAHF